MSLLSAEELLQVQKVAELGMVTTVVIHRRSVTTPTVEANDYGDDEVSFSTTGGGSITVKGWLSSRPVEMPDPSGGALVTTTTYRLFLPVGTPVSPGDQVTVGSREFTVSDTTAESTWPALLTVSLRGRE